MTGRESTNEADDPNVEGPLASDAPPADQETHRAQRGEAADLRLHFRQQILLNRALEAADTRADELALMALDDLAVALETGQQSERTLKMIATFLRDILRQSEATDAKWDKSAALAMRVLGCSQVGTPKSAALVKARVIAAYERVKDAGHADDACMAAAYGAQFGADAYERDKAIRGPFESRRGSKEFPTLAEKNIAVTLAPILRRAGLLIRSVGGRPSAKLNKKK